MELSAKGVLLSRLCRLDQADSQGGLDSLAVFDGLAFSIVVRPFRETNVGAAVPIVDMDRDAVGGHHGAQGLGAI